MMDFLQDIKRHQGLEVSKKGNVLPKTILAIAAIALVAVMIIRLQHKSDRSDRHEAFDLQPAVLIKKLPDPSNQGHLMAHTETDAKIRVATIAEDPEQAKPGPSQEGLDLDGVLQPRSPEQPDLEKAIDMLMKRRSPKY